MYKRQLPLLAAGVFRLREGYMRTTFTTMLTDAQAGRLESSLEEKGFERREVPYARFSFAGPSLLATVYEKKGEFQGTLSEWKNQDVYKRQRLHWM